MNIEEFVDTVLLGDLGKMVNACGLQYLAFGTIACGVEFLGACLDSHPFDEQGRSRCRFDNAIRALFSQVYHPYAVSTSPHYLYTKLRCGMSHILRPQTGVAFATKGEATDDGHSNLEIVNDAGTRKLVLVCGDFYVAFTCACGEMKRKLGSGTYSKSLADHCLRIT